ncbi:hypothetical protein PNIG_a0433 [Pseudoalteromonas nigrifaciens]|uniref:V8-like Glu-specific endopeptidase n=1 Tax=Pseudoalteromonas nigrifaciens TaxID=28109 RepID=A0AAC9UH90_9GAMM|nr:AVAST type 1 anti-phage system protease Avs1b [Pseudoalteromonas nigrifaciens]ASM52751.1 hypothetical protein PNIG_a0433 [Pseudoalteromonas nigrifaciens]GEN43230.1 hypothetical protein PNI02_26960 [Pseudoalteromonas nigrifaciens]SUC53369.1 V8-like Glu-specific endopeptidase [Pseudoalteromonas nigrifaciens]
MLDAEAKYATCKVNCGGEQGTGTLITNKVVMTAAHCVNSTIDNKFTIEVVFDFNDKPLALEARVIAYSLDLDIALLELDKDCGIRPISLRSTSPVSGSRFFSYGFPANKLTMGHRLEGNLEQVFDNFKLGSDIEISIDAALSLDNYQGFSGAAIICEGACVGVIRVSIEKTMGAISISAVYDFLNEYGIHIKPEETHKKSSHLISREIFIEEFDSFVCSQINKYIFIKGAHGLGKSVFCETYSPSNSTLEKFGAYSFTTKKSSKNAIQLAQPQEFFNWLNIQVSMLITSNPGRKEILDYQKIIDKTGELFIQLAEFYTLKNKVGILFIDGLDEVERQDAETLNKLIGLMPARLPPGLVIVFSAPNYDQFATRLGNRLSNESCISLPPLNHEPVQAFCYQSLREKHSNSKTVNLICERAQGHPLYLHYLIDLANSGTSADEIKSLPLIEGSIRKYYDIIWMQLREDNDAVNLLAIAVRLRWGIPISHFTDILNSHEQAILISTLGRMQHLLLDNSETTIYHSSFSDFIIEKTQLRERDIQLRLAKHCEEMKLRRYCLLNLIYHNLKAKGAEKTHVMELCNQNWVDDCVYNDVEPDTLIDDLHSVLKVATEQGNLVETVRILLLSQRIQFRYNTLLSQSADLTANALISIDKKQEVIKHISRYGHLIVSFDEALSIALKLIDSNNNEEALELLNIVESHLTENLEAVFKSNGLSYKNFLYIYDLQIQQFLLRVRAGHHSSKLAIANFQHHWMNIIDKTSENEEASKLIRSEMFTYMQTASMCLIDRFITISELQKVYSGPLNELAEPIVFSAYYYQMLCEKYGINQNILLLEQAFSDIKTLISEAWNAQMKVHPNVVDSFILNGAPRDIIIALSKDNSSAPAPINFISSDSVFVDEEALNDGMSEWRMKAFIEANFPRPNLVKLHSETWIVGIKSTLQLIAWCDGSARRFKSTGNIASLESVWNILHVDILNQLKFRLSERAEWIDSYGLPEDILPYIYESIIKLVSDIFPEKAYEILSFIEGQFKHQCGIYSEGFRRILSEVLDIFTRSGLNLEAEDKAFDLVELWLKFVIPNLKNRHELVPDLLKIIPLFTKLGATEKAAETYRLVLAYSMGPNWYKEDQLGLSITALKSQNSELTLPSGSVNQIAGLLDAAGGEMTFQRYVRYAKRDFLSALCSRSDYLNAVNYFIKQTYGTIYQMYQDVTHDDIDRVSKLRGTRFPGTALDEQDSVLVIIESLAPNADWQLCWALLESYQFGDSRYITRFAEVYGLLIDKVSEDDKSMSLIIDRLEIICESEFSNKSNCSEFIASIAPFIPEQYKNIFEDKFCELLAVSSTGKFKVQTAEEKKDKVDNIGNQQAEETSDLLYMPGTFGRKDSIDEAATAFSNAERFLRRQNYSEGQKEIISGLNSIQTAGWPIWAGQMSESVVAQSLLLETTNSVTNLIKLYSPLILNERYADNWRIADCLIKWLTSHSSDNEQLELIRVTCEHTKLMVGNINEETAIFSSHDNMKESSNCLVTLLLHAIEHPSWQRREKASDMLIWLSQSFSKFVHLFGAKAFTMDSGAHPDLICGALEQLSSSSPKLWETLSKELDFCFIEKNCKHLGRYSVLVKLARDAASKELESAEEALNTLMTRFDCVGADKDKKNYIELPSWAECISDKWEKLNSLGFLSTGVVTEAESILKVICSSFSANISLELEQLLAEGYYGNVKNPVRWQDKVCFVLQVALQNFRDESDYKKIESIFRKYNPSRLDNLRVKKFKSPALHWLESKKISPMQEDIIFLDYCERVFFQGKLRLVRLTAYLSDKPNEISLPSGRFLSVDKPMLDNTSLLDTCANVSPLPAYFGSFTPAIPTTDFMRNTNSSSSSIKRAWWRSGRLKDTYKGAPSHEGCFLSIKASSLQLPQGFKLIWIFELDHKPVSIISFG